MNDPTAQAPAWKDTENTGATEHPAGEMLPATRSKAGARARALAGLAVGLGVAVAGAGTIDTTPALAPLG